MLKLSKLEKFIIKSKAIHGDKYSYEKFKYVSAFKKVEIFCKACNKYFFQTAAEHINYGCYDCSVLYRGNLRKNKEDACILVGKRDAYIAKYKTVNLYLVEFKSNDEIFYKIGITSSEDIMYRFRQKEFKNYTITVIDVLNYDTKMMIELEDEILMTFKEHRYNPKHKFSGHTECFNSHEILFDFINEKRKLYDE